jgi:competence protein ComEC
VVQCLARFIIDADGPKYRIRLFVVDPLHVLLVQPTSPTDRAMGTADRFIQTGLVAPPMEPGPSRSLAMAIVLGVRSIGWDDLADPFRRTGTAHLLAVSGLHLAILCGVMLAVARVLGLPPRGAAFMAVLVCVVMLLMVTVRTPILRAAVMAVCGSVLLGVRWRVSAGTTLSTAIILVLFLNPLAIRSPGFQLSFAVVASLIWLLPRWSSRSHVPGTRRSIWIEAIRSATIAWCVATPVAIYHFGTYSILGIPATLLLTPIMAAVLVIGYIRILFLWLDPVSSLAGALLDALCDLLWSSVGFIAHLPGSGLHMAAVGWPSVVLVEVATVLFFATRSSRVARWSAAIMVLWWSVSILIAIQW